MSRLLRAFPIAAGLIATTAHAGGPYFPSASFFGKGSCKTPGGLGSSYDTNLKLSGWGIERSEHDQLSVMLTTKDQGYGIFDVLKSDKKIGDGYCGQPCHIKMTTTEGDEDWTFQFIAGDDEHLHLTRALRKGNALTVCEDYLTKVATPQDASTKTKPPFAKSLDNTCQTTVKGKPLTVTVYELSPINENAAVDVRYGDVFVRLIKGAKIDGRLVYLVGHWNLEGEERLLFADGGAAPMLKLMLKGAAGTMSVDLPSVKVDKVAVKYTPS